MNLGKTEKQISPSGKLSLRRRMLSLEQELILDRQKCCGCMDCQTICPTDAVSSTEPVVEEGRVREPIRMDIDPGKCIYCGLCMIVCPAKSITWRENENTMPTVMIEEILPPLDEGVDVQVADCRSECELACQAACPADAITVKTENSPENGGSRIIDVEVDPERCFYCGRCMVACPYECISVRKSRQGIVIFSPEHCPLGCQACADVCPSGALELREGHIVLEESFCIYCRACTHVCPESRALEVKRDRIRGGLPHSHLWMEVQGKLVSVQAKAHLVEDQTAEKRARAFRTRID
ncbi:MAG: 4Fe-4S binding protein [Desulfobacteraceae bacterium]|nr:4Fe-4S binding protein [Desulfobacteraceae bacterium]